MKMQEREPCSLEREKNPTKDGKDEKNNTLSNMYIPWRTKKFHFNTEISIDIVTADRRQITEWEIPISTAVTKVLAVT